MTSFIRQCQNKMAATLNSWAKLSAGLHSGPRPLPHHCSSNFALAMTVPSELLLYHHPPAPFLSLSLPLSRPLGCQLYYLCACLPELQAKRARESRPPTAQTGLRPHAARFHMPTRGHFASSGPVVKANEGAA